MPVKQYYNGKIKAWVKGEVRVNMKGNKYFKAIDVKQKDPMKPFKGIPKGNSMKKKR